VHFTQFLTGRKHGRSIEALGHGIYGSVAKRSLQKHCKNYPKKSWSDQRVGVVAPLPPKYATIFTKYATRYGVTMVVCRLCRCAISSSRSNHRVEGERPLTGARVAAAARRGRLGGARLRGRDDGERQRRAVGQGRVRVEPRDKVHGGRARRGRQLLLPCIRREQSRTQSTAAVRLRHSLTAAWYVELYVLFYQSTSPSIFFPN